MKHDIYVGKTINSVKKTHYYDKSYKITKEDPTPKDNTRSVIILLSILITATFIYILNTETKTPKQELQVEKISKPNENKPNKYNHGVTLDLIDISSNINTIGEIQARKDNTESKVIASLIESRNSYIKNFFSRLYEINKIEEKFNEIALYNDGKRHMEILKDKYQKTEILLQEEYNHILEFDTLILKLLGTQPTNSESVKIKKKFPDAPKEFNKK